MIVVDIVVVVVQKSSKFVMFVVVAPSTRRQGAQDRKMEKVKVKHVLPVAAAA